MTPDVLANVRFWPKADKQREASNLNRLGLMAGFILQLDLCVVLESAVALWTLIYRSYDMTMACVSTAIRRSAIVFEMAVSASLVAVGVKRGGRAQIPLMKRKGLLSFALELHRGMQFSCQES